MRRDQVPVASSTCSSFSSFRSLFEYSSHLNGSTWNRMKTVLLPSSLFVLFDLEFGSVLFDMKTVPKRVELLVSRVFWLWFAFFFTSFSSSSFTFSSSCSSFYLPSLSICWFKVERNQIKFSCCSTVIHWTSSTFLFSSFQLIRLNWTFVDSLTFFILFLFVQFRFWFQFRMFNFFKYKYWLNYNQT